MADKYDLRAVYLTAEGRTQCMADWCRDLPHLKPVTVSSRRSKGWTDRQALGLDPPPPKRKIGGPIEYDGKSMTASQWKWVCGVDPLTIRYRIEQGWTPGQALGYEPPPTDEQG